MISDHLKWLIVICIPLMATAADQPCNLAGAKRSGPGWLSDKTQGVLVYLISTATFETGPRRVPWATNAQARYAALTGFSDYFRKISAPDDEHSVLMVKGLQVRSLKCAEGLFISYEIKLSDISWGIPELEPSSKNDEPTPPINQTNIVKPLTDVSTPTKPPARNSGPKVIIEN